MAYWAFASYLLVAIVQTWPLPAHLSSHLTGDPNGDGGVYVWNTWVFRHELELRHSPFFTESILALDTPTDLSLHNYTVFPDLLAWPLQRAFGLIAAFNVAYLLQVPLLGLGMFVLARRVGGTRVGVGEAWLAGLFFCCAPYLIARGAGHYSLAAAAPLPFFAWCLHRALVDGRARDALGAGACAAWAFSCDPYFAVYCLIVGAAMMADACLVLSSGGAASNRTRTIANAVIMLAILVAIAVRLSGGTAFSIGGARISLGSLYTPMLVLGLLSFGRIWLQWRPRVRWRAQAAVAPLVRVTALAGLAGAVLIGPTLYALARRAINGDFVAVPLPWRSSAPGVDLLAFLLPNPNHPLAPHALVAWLGRQPGGYVENVASLSWVALAVIAIAAWHHRTSIHRLWFAIGVGAALLAVGPFLRIGGVSTLLPTPWTFLRYAPIIEEARMPGRIAIVVAMGAAVVFAGALAALTERAAARRRAILVTVGLLMAVELWPAPRTLYSAALPRVADVIAEDPRNVSVLDLPFGLKDGLITSGGFSPSAQFRQTRHGKPLIGGYLSRISDSTREKYSRDPFTAALLVFSEGRLVSPPDARAAEAAADTFAARVNLGYVVMDDARVSPTLREFALHALHLTSILQADGFTLYAPDQPKPSVLAP